MDRPMFGRAGSIALGLLLLNVVVLVAGLTLEHWRAQPRALIGYNVDKVRLLNKVGATPDGGGVAKPEGAQADAASNLSTAQPDDAAVSPAGGSGGVDGQVALPTGPVCLKASLAGPAAYAALRRAMGQAGLGGQSLRTEERLGWWVYWPPLDDPVQQVQALAAIDRAGVKDVAPIRQGPMARAISLGMFASEADARAQHGVLSRRGLEALRYGPRPGIRAVYLDIPAADRDKLPALRAAAPAGVTLEAVACPG